MDMDKPTQALQNWFTIATVLIYHMKTKIIERII